MGEHTPRKMSNPFTTRDFPALKDLKLHNMPLSALIWRLIYRENVDTPRLLQYVVRILGSRMAPSVVGDEHHLSQVIQKKCKPSFLSFSALPTLADPA